MHADGLCTQFGGASRGGGTHSQARHEPARAPTRSRAWSGPRDPAFGVRSRRATRGRQAAVSTSAVQTSESAPHDPSRGRRSSRWWRGSIEHGPRRVPLQGSRRHAVGSPGAPSRACPARGEHRGRRICAYASALWRRADSGPLPAIVVMSELGCSDASVQQSRGLGRCGGASMAVEAVAVREQRRRARPKGAPGGGQPPWACGASRPR